MGCRPLFIFLFTKMGVLVVFSHHGPSVSCVESDGNSDGGGGRRRDDDDNDEKG